MYTGADHTFALCAYQESPYLEECIRSLLGQSVKSNVVLATSTPSPFLEAVAEKYGLPLFVNPGEGGIGQDWNFGYQQAQTPLVTVAHQDDVYAPEYLERILSMLNEARHPLIAFTDYYELRQGRRVDRNRLLTIKRVLLFPLRAKAFRASQWIRRRSLSLGCGICCPAVTYVRDHLPCPVFLTDYKCDLDWQTWERLSKLDGEFLYDPGLLVGHRIHPDSETTRLISDNARSREDLEMYQKFWPRWIARLLAGVYKNSERSNDDHPEP